MSLWPLSIANAQKNKRKARWKEDEIVCLKYTHTANLFSMECYFLILQMLNNAAFNIALILMS